MAAAWTSAKSLTVFVVVAPALLGYYLQPAQETEVLPCIELPSELVRKLPRRDPQAQNASRKVPKTDGTPHAEHFPTAQRFDFPDVSHWPTPNFNVSVLSVLPRVFLFENFISEDEARLLIDFADGRTQPAQTVAGSSTARDDYYRNNEQYLSRQQEEIDSPIINHVMRRTHRASRVPTENGEGLQFGRYAIGEFFFMHNDAVDPSTPRLSTFLTYLQAPLSGGETLFAFTKEASVHCLRVRAECCENPPAGTYVVKPKVGRSVLFYNYDEEAKFTGAMHMACPVKEGVKWVFQRWMRFSPYQNVAYPHDAGVDSKSDRAWDVRPLTAHMYYVQQLFSKNVLKELFGGRAITGDEQRRLDTTVQSFRPRTIDFVESEVVWAPATAQAILLVFFAPGSLVLVDNCREFCCSQEAGQHFSANATDAVLWYPRTKQEYAVCGRVMRVVYRPE